MPKLQQERMYLLPRHIRRDLLHMSEVQLPLVLSPIQFCRHLQILCLHMVECLPDAVFPFVPGDIRNHKRKLIPVLRCFHLHFQHIIPVFQRFLFLL